MSVVLSSGLYGLTPMAFAMPGATEMLIFLFVVLLLFGGAKLPSLMRNLGRSANEFKRGMSETADEDEPADKDVVK